MKRYDVRIAVWLAVAIMSFEKYHEVAKRRKPKISDFYFRQADILPRAEAIAIGKVHSARLSQWYNGDHKNSNYNYLRAEGSLRRLTQSGEFSGEKEQPMDLRLDNFIATEVGNLTIGELMDWVKTTYSLVESEDDQGNEDKVYSEKIEENQVMKEIKVDEKEKSKTQKESQSNKDATIESLPIETYLEKFMDSVNDGSIDVYNEFSLKHELGNYLLEKVPKNYKIQFERKVTDFGVNGGETIKNKMDCVIFNSNKNYKYCIAIKYPINKQIPLAMYKIIKDFKLLEQLLEHDFVGCYQITLIDDQEFINGVAKEGIYEYFRTDAPIHGEILKPTGRNDEKIIIEGYYQMYWLNLKDGRNFSIVKI